MSASHDPLSPFRSAAHDLDASADAPDWGRRSAVIRIGGWVICAGVLGGSIPIDALTSAHATPSQSIAPIPCDCTAVSGIDLGIQTTDIALNSAVYVTLLTPPMFVCRDAAGYFAMTSICSHAGCDLGQTAGVFTPTNLTSGFHCTCHGSGFSGDGSVSNGPAYTPLQHYRLSVDATTKHLFIDLTPPFADITCRCPG